MKKILCCLALIFVVFVIPVSAAETDSTQSQDDAMFQEYYEQQAEDSGANDLPNYLPDDTKSQLDQMGIAVWTGTVSSRFSQTVYFLRF